LGAGGNALATAARDSFMVGSRYAMYMGAVLLVVGAVFVFVRAQQPEMSADTETLDDELGAIAGEQLVEFRPALAIGETSARPEEIRT
jgi:hypothetical protein